ncbi:hypothetical protein [Nocardia bhagyanarayanae]|uniref:hypothetical protein n=1 Tax=Nocardia bhagyanarayanae TaxID=1215925 RepID=UPI00114E9D88|nr:hypothetical protein [Nocardia bhagyanarayanae]
MRRWIGDGVDVVTAFIGAAVAGIALFLPITFAWTAQSTPYRIASLINSVPRGATIGMVVAVTVAVLITTFARPLVGWIVAFGGALGMYVNHFAGRDVSSADLLTTQNYIDAVCGGIILGALGAAALRRRASAIGYVLGAVSFFVFGDLADLLDLPDQDPWSVLETPPFSMIGIAVVLLFVAIARNRDRAGPESDSTVPIDLPITPILAAIVLGLIVLAATEWLAAQYNNVSAPGDNRLEIAIAVAATISAALIAAMLLPGRDGVGVLLAVSLVATADSLGYVPRPWWSVFVVLALTALGLFAGLRAPSPFLALLALMGVTVFAWVDAHGDGTFYYSVATVLLALTAGFCGGAARPRYGPSAVLAIGALYLPSVVTALPVENETWPPRDNMAHATTPGRVALMIVVGCTIALLLLYRLRPRAYRKPAPPVQRDEVADI